jgi:Mrp family chromosome partitioning ATPase
MSEKSEQLTSEEEVTKNSLTDPALPRIEAKDLLSTVEAKFASHKHASGAPDTLHETRISPPRSTTDATQRLQAWRERDKSTPDITVIEAKEEAVTDEKPRMQVIEKKDVASKVAMPPAQPTVVEPKKTRGKKQQPTKRDVANARMLQESCRQLCLSLFYREHTPVHSLGFTSSIDGEGKSFLASVTAQVLAHDSSKPVTLVECDWEHPSQHDYFGIPATPGLAEWLRGTCDEEDIRHRVDENLTIIPAGMGSRDAVKLLNQLLHHGLQNTFKHANELYIVDLPPIIASGYGSLASSMLESVVLVVRAQVISESMVVETCMQLKDAPIHGIILNQDESRIPLWIRQLQ